MKVSLLLALTVFQTQPVNALSKTCDQAAYQSAETYGVPPSIMLAITRVETGRTQGGSLEPWPWAVNLSGSSHWFQTPAEAEDFVQSAIQEGHTNIDLGCFQLNYRWHGEMFSSLQEMLDPLANADHAARFLVENFQRKGNWVDAVAAYHSATPAYAEAYVEKVESVLTELTQNGTVPERQAKQTKPKPNQFPLLQPGERGAMASLVPSNSTATPLLIATP